MKYIVVIAVVLCFACSKSETREGKLSLSTKTFSSERCVDSDCAKVEASWPVVENISADSILNKKIENQLLVYFHQDKKFDNLDSAANDFLDSYEKFKIDFPGAPGEWKVELEVKLTYESDNILSFKFSEYNFSGGAHPNSSVYYMNFEKLTGESLGVDQVILDKGKMLQLAEAAFRKYHEVEEGVELKNDGRFFLPETGFFLPNAMGYEEGKFILTYIPYEIGPYVLGYTELEFSFEEVKGIVRDL
ncbi:DUF4163 domain-containing protein [Algoriphagus sp. Y33]|uniref:DUF4163 domain-containing protein n=1 Tax=Algoriphagus sp. Y33 TaxID=2772483 RepID=UPI001785F6A8|nr:DUF4163 domain-containing protein [Algoriphagus sp. Y33]